jgi:hypothetical protein
MKLRVWFPLIVHGTGQLILPVTTMIKFVAERSEPLLCQSLPHATHQIGKIPKIVDGIQPRSQHLLDQEQVV